MIKGFISNAMFTIKHIRAKNNISYLTAFREWLWNEMQLRKMKRTNDIIEQHFLRDYYHSKFIPKRDSLNSDLKTLKRL